MTDLPFDNPYNHGFARVAVALPEVRVADPYLNATRTIELAERASERGAAVVVFPELGLSSYAIDDLLHQQALLSGCLEALDGVRSSSSSLAPLLLVGAPISTEGRLFNCAVAIQGGQILGVVPKSYLPNYREYYERRQFSPASTALRDTTVVNGQEVPFSSDLLFQALGVEDLVVHAELCEDLWTPVPPSTWGALAGATVLCNLSASNVTVGKLAYRRTITAAQSGRCVAAYLYAGCGTGESTTDLAWDGHGMIYENGELLAESERFTLGSELLVADIDLERLRKERMQLTSFGDTVEKHRHRLRRSPRVSFRFTPPPGELELEREIPRFPYVPTASADLDERCEEAYHIQVHGLAQRLRATGIQKLVIGVSGGLDSTQALLVAVRTMEKLALPRENVLAYTMPGFATSDHTLSNARALMASLGVSAHEIDIRPSCEQMLRDLDHPFSRGEAVYDVTFENVQAGERTSHLFRLANLHGALVLGTGDLSELALGWTTYGVGDHMSHYNPNVSVPKTLIQHLIRWLVRTERFDPSTCEVLTSIVATEISPELIPGEKTNRPTQSTEQVIGPYELQDFHLYFLTRRGYRPSKVAYLAWQAWRDAESGSWPETLPGENRRQYDLSEIRHWLEIFVDRFFRLSQFKRSALPNGPKVGSGGSLSPRGDWRAPSDASSEAWLRELRAHVPDSSAE